MIICCKPRNINSVFFLFTILAQLGSNCNFEYDPIASPGTYKEKINDLKEYLIQDYQVQDFSSSLLDSKCSPLWELFYIYTELRAIENKSGSVLAEKINLVTIEFKFVEECSFKKSVDATPQNKTIIFILNRTIDLLDELKSEHKILNDYSHCTLIQHKSDDSPKTALRQGDELTEQPSHRVRYLIMNGPIAVIIIIISLILIRRIFCRKSTNEATG